MLNYPPSPNKQDIEDARRGFIADLPSSVVKGDAANTGIDLPQHAFLKQKLGKLADPGQVKCDGDHAKLKQMLGNVDKFDFLFTIAAP